MENKLFWVLFYDIRDKKDEEILLNKIKETKEACCVSPIFREIEQCEKKVKWLHRMNEIKEYNIAAIESWLDENMPKYIASVAKFVWFGVSGDYFVAVIPDSWNDVQFDSTADGHLVVMN